LVYLPYGDAGRNFAFSELGINQLESYLAIVILGSLGYGAVFLLLSMTFRNPVAPALIFFGWEAINPVLPPVLQLLSVASYLRHIMPITVPGEGIFALLTVETEAVPVWAAIVGLLLLIAVVLAWSCYRIRRLEIRYTTE